MTIVKELQLVLLLVTVWVTERLCKRVNVSPIIGQILAGLVVGPALIDVIPHVQAFRLLGKVGVMVLVVESGLIVDLDDVRRYGLRASLAAATGVILPTILSFVLFTGIIGTTWKVSEKCAHLSKKTVYWNAVLQCRHKAGIIGGYTVVYLVLRSLEQSSCSAFQSSHYGLT